MPRWSLTQTLVVVFLVLAILAVIVLIAGEV